jgi:DNA adenine methylase
MRVRYDSLVAIKVRPILKWAGGKSGLLSQMWPHFPVDFERYVEPFIGGAAVFLSLPEPKPSLLNDSNGELIHLYRTVRDQPRELAAALAEFTLLYSEEFFYALRDEKPEEALRRAARTIFLNKTGFNGLYRMNSREQFNVPFGKRPKCPALCNLENFLRVAEKLKTATLSHADFEVVLDQAGPGDFVYCDPPYAPVSKTASFTSYTHRGFSLDEQARLKQAADRARARGARVVVSNSWTEEMLKLYSDWKIVEIQARRAINSDGGGRGKVSELLAVG